MTTRPKGLVSNIRAAFGGEAIQLPLSLAVFVGLVVSLSETDFGLWAAVTSTSMIIGTFANLGAQELLVREVARGADFGRQWGVMLTTQTLGAVLGFVVAIVARQVFFPEVPLAPALLLMTTNLLFFWAIEGCVRCGQALELLHIGARARLVFAIARVAGVGCFVLLDSDQLETYALVAFPFALVGTAFALFDVMRVTGTRPTLALASWRFVKDGLPFVGMYGAQDMLAQFDRPMMQRAELTVEVGAYAIADRAARLASIPSLAVARATSAQFFQAGERDPQEAYGLAKKYALPTAAYGVVAMVGMWLAVWLLGDFAPDRIQDSVPMLAWLAPIPLFHALQMFPANMLTGSDRQPLRTSLYGLAVVVNVIANLALIPRIGWEGAAMSTLVAEAALVLMLWTAASRESRRRPRSAQPTL